MQEVLREGRLHQDRVAKQTNTRSTTSHYFAHVSGTPNKWSCGARRASRESAGTFRGVQHRDLSHRCRSGGCRRAAPTAAIGSPGTWAQHFALVARIRMKNGSARASFVEGPGRTWGPQERPLDRIWRTGDHVPESSLELRLSNRIPSDLVAGVRAVRLLGLTVQRAGLADRNIRLLGLVNQQSD